MTKRFTRGAIGLASAGLLSLAIVPTAAHAAKPSIRNNFHELIPGIDICGVTGDLDARGVQIITFTDTGFVVNGQVTQVLTTADGHQATIRAAGRTTSSVVQNGDIVTITDSYKGLPEMISSRGRGGVVIRDAGIITFVTTFNVVTNEVTTDVVVRGPHPEADSDFTLFCTAFRQAIGA
jgi:hypothetical protein